MKSGLKPLFAPIALALSLAAAPTSATGQAAGMSAQDLVTMPRVGGPSTSPDGRFAVYPVTLTDPDTYERSTSHFILDLADPAASPMPLDLGGEASDVRFGAGGYLYFLSSRAAPGSAADAGDSKSQIWRVAVQNGRPTGAPSQVSTLEADIAGYSVSPDGTKLLVFGDVLRSCPTFGCADAKGSHLPGPGTGRLYEGDVGFVRHWDQWETPGIYSRAFVFPIVEGRLYGDGAAVDGPAGEGALIGDTPTKPFGGTEDLAWAPDSSAVYFAARKANADEPVSTNVDIYRSDLSGQAPVNLTAANTAFDTLPAPSPDGKYLAYAAMERPGYEADRLVVQLRDLDTGETRAVTSAWDRSAGSIAWTPDSRYLVVTAQDVLDTPAFRIDPRDGTVTRLTLSPGREGHIGNVAPLPDGALLFTRDTIESPAEIYLAPDDAPGRQLTSHTAVALAELQPVTTRRFSFAGANGDTVWGQITKPAGTDEKLPAILYVHGGPQGSFNDSWSSRWNPRVVASQGYAVVSVDFHGSTGYGQAFTGAITRDWGGKPLEDLQKGLAAAVELDRQIDGGNACAMGASYGGYMMNWIAGKWPDRFKCLIQHDGVFDQRAMYYETEELWFIEWEHGGKAYFEAPEEFEKWNPVNYVNNWQTPMLVITGEKDFRIPYTQGIASFTALQRKGIPSQLLVFPDENHWVLKPKNSLQWHSTVFGWLDRWLKDDAAPGAAIP
ncbi:S9 family peptidase [Allopontixanthobacter sp.]|uniref:S9 family peptidase n=1 Tax=Allopontixanthobacter sp. TaxID=2906452 RepID=UPI002AB85496|nr:S9 family peptidase [Allopontixanthobacter sp.]MDZ4308498.1 S9 family peptidase [Allopontixanthobacter sp.]